MNILEIILIVTNILTILWLILLNSRVSENYEYQLSIYRSLAEDLGEHKYNFQLLLKYLSLELIKSKKIVKKHKNNE